MCEVHNGRISSAIMCLFYEGDGSKGLGGWGGGGGGVEREPGKRRCVGKKFKGRQFLRVLVTHY